VNILSRITVLFCLFLLTFSSITYSQAPSTIDGYLYMSQIERIFGADMEEEYVWSFRNGDTLNGVIRSNDFIYIHDRPIFLGPVYSSQDSFMEHNANCYFEYDPQLGVPEFEFPFVLEEMQEIAEERDSYYAENGWQSRLEANEWGWLLSRWPYGVGYNEYTVEYQDSWAYDEETIFYIEGNLDIFGSNVKGNTTIVCDGTVRILDDLTYDGTIIGDNIVIPDDTTATLGLIATGDILVANTPANGMENGLNTGEFSDHSNKHCVITASIVSLNGSFSFENKNFSAGEARFDGYQWCDPDGHHSNEIDRRGTIYLLGSLAFHRRDYIRTSNCGTTGYDRHYRYDHRLEELTPPLFETQLSVSDGPRTSATFPITHRVEKVYPNPFNSSFNLNMTLIKRDQVRIRLINVLGQEIYSQNYGWMEKGDQRFVIDIADKPAGLYFTEILTSSGFRQTSKVVFMK